MMQTADSVSVLSGEVENFAVSGALVLARLSGVMVFAPVFSSPAIAPRIKAAFVIAVTVLVAPIVGRTGGEVTVAGVLGELGVGLTLGLCLGLLTEMMNFAGALLSMEFSFSLVNLMDPNTMVETPVLGQLLGWFGVLVLLGAGLHRTLLSAVLGTFTMIPPGNAVFQAATGAAIAHMAGGVFVAGVQLASPVIAAALAVEFAMALISRLSPQLPANVLSVPLKTMVSYVVLIGSLAVWPWFIERRFDSLLSAAGRMLSHA